MSQVVDTAGAPGTSPAGAVAPQGITPPGSPPPPAPAAEPKPAPPVPKESSLAEVIRERRAAREAAHRESTRAQSLEAKVRELESALEETRRASGDFEDDPVGYAKTRKWSPEQQLLYGKALMFDLVPEKADPDFRIKMFEDRQKREEKRRESEAKQREEARALETTQQQLQNFYAETQAAVKSFAQGSYPESEDWFGGDLNTYMQSIMATAANLSEAANKEGRVADLSPAALAATLEAEVARKLTERDQRRAARPKTNAVTQAPAESSGEQTAETVSTRNLSGSGVPQPPPRSDKERIQRAIAAGFRGR